MWKIFEESEGPIAFGFLRSNAFGMICFFVRSSKRSAMNDGLDES